MYEPSERESELIYAAVRALPALSKEALEDIGLVLINARRLGKRNGDRRNRADAGVRPAVEEAL